MERVQHGFDRGVTGLEGSKAQLEQKLREEKEASKTILDYLEKHYTVSPFVSIVLDASLLNSVYSG